MRYLILFIIISFSTIGFSQPGKHADSLITIKGQVIDTNFNVGFYNLVVLNKNVGKGIFGQYNGSFEIRVKKSDTIGVSVVGYQTVYLSYQDSTFKPTYSPVFYIQPLSYTGNEVVVKPLKTLEELAEERANISKREVPTVTMSNAFTSPITALYVAFSKREKTKRKVAEMEYEDSQDDIVREILRIYVHADIIDLSSEDFDEFINFLNLNPEFLKTATDYELIVYIKAKFEHFQKIKEGF